MMNNEIFELKQTINECNQKIKHIQDSCLHEYQIIEHGGNTGNYDGNTYWTRYKCIKCEKNLTIYKDL